MSDNRKELRYARSGSDNDRMEALPQAVRQTSVTATETSCIAATPQPPYYAVIFTSIRRNDNSNKSDYSITADRMMELASRADGFLGVESVRDESKLGITVSYWRDLESIRVWKHNSEHLVAQEKGQREWYSAYTTRICKVERDYSHLF
ncbi:protein of unknown function DUF4188 containing protein [Nitzschia inconspicua]|uniref:ABM domain-containing protein n=1 Tax=Nitzschia inconspicua TaxID=303405 RepID=A0A9K3PQJ9_9STRA|nr:protein of unknown function DUF4188 containing protein [Nitzschia inconspicua]